MPAFLRHVHGVFAMPALALLVPVCAARAQQLAPTDNLPDAPSVVQPASFLSGDDGQAGQGTAPAVPGVAKKYATTIKPGQAAQPLSAADKFKYVVHLQSTPMALGSALFSAGYGHLVDGRPHMGTDSAGFGERLGSAALRRTTAYFIGYGVVGSLLHEDPRYYRLGPQVKPVRRAVYAGTRFLITRKDNGAPTVNAAALIGIAASQAIVQTYYPRRDRGVDEAVMSTLSSYATTAGLTVVREFLPDVIAHLRHKK